MERDEIISRAVKIVSANSKNLRFALDNYRGKYQVITDEGSFFIDNKDNYSIREIVEIFENKNYTGVRVSYLDFPSQENTYVEISSIPEVSSNPFNLSYSGSSPSGSTPSTPSTSSTSGKKVFYYTLGSNKGIIYIKEDSDTPYVVDAFERLLGRIISDLQLTSYDVSERPLVDDNKYQSLSDFVSNPKFTSRPPVSGNIFSDEVKTFYYKVQTDNGLFLIRDESKDVLDSNEIKLILKRSFRYVEILDIKRSLGTPHTGYADSDYQTLSEFFNNPRDASVSSSPVSDPLDTILDEPATMDPPPNALLDLMKGGLSGLSADLQKKIAAHRTNYWMLHRLFRDSLSKYRINSSTTVNSLRERDRKIGEILINLYDDIVNGQVTQKEFITRMRRVQEINSDAAQKDADILSNFIGVPRKDKK